ncbi:phosphoglycerate kinase, partial [Dehalococcoidia bacterium]|nr:phosphoglycerate kinase [Dehalococcoidia bacterium]
LKAQGYEMGRSIIEEERVELARDILRNAKIQGVLVHLPQDLVVSETFADNGTHRTLPVSQIPNDGYVMDIGASTIGTFTDGLRQCHTILWNGPMGVFEFDSFSHGTRAVAEALADSSGTITVVGGGSTAEAVEQMGLTNSMNHVSMGGGASLEFMEGRELPGISRLLDKD